MVLISFTKPSRPPCGAFGAAGKTIRGRADDVVLWNRALLGANVYLHYVFDLWAEQWRHRQARGEMIIVRYADDFAVGFQHRADADAFLVQLRERFRQFNLELPRKRA